ncbi:MAG: hypothetical protein ACYS1A_19420 [Planctomycetota bacterium]|jgi:hypothetical protein
MKILEREIDSITFAASQTRTIRLPRNYAYRKLFLKLEADLTRTTTAGTSTNGCKDSAPAQLVANIVVRANGRDVIKNIDMESLHRLNQLHWGTRPHIYSHDWIGGDDAADKDLMVYAEIDFEMWRAIHPVDTMLDSAGLATLELIITFGTGMDTMDDAWQAEAGAAVTVNSATLYVASLEAVGVPPKTRFMINKEYMIRSQVSASSSNHQIDLPVGNMYRSIVLKTHSDGVQVDTILNNIIIQAGTEVFKNRIASFLQMDNRLLYAIEVPERNGSGAALNHYLQELLLEGYYCLEFVVDGRLTEVLDTSQLSDLKLVLDVNSVGTDDFIDVFSVELIRPAIAVA